MLVVGISGVTNSGKTTLAEALHKVLPRSQLLRQDEYYWPIDNDQHILVPKINTVNWEIMSSMDMDTMWKDINDILNNEHLYMGSSHNDSSLVEKEDTKVQEGSNVIQGCDATKNDVWDVTDFETFKTVDVLIIEGILVLNYSPIAGICDLKYHLTLTKDVCHTRRCARTYDTPDVPGYFDVCVWPEYVKHREEMLQTVEDVKMIDGTQDINSILSKVIKDICEKIKNVN